MRDPALSAMEREAAEFLLFEFAEEALAHDSLAASEIIARVRAQQLALPRRLALPVYRNGRNLLHVTHRSLRFSWDPILACSASLSDPDTLARQDQVYQHGNGFSFWGTLGRHLGFFLSSRDTKEHGTRTYPVGSRLAWPRHGFARGHGTHIYHDETEGYLHLTLPHVAVLFGKNFNRWGPGRSGALALSNFATSYDQLKVAVRYGPAQFTFLHAALRQYPPLVTAEYMANGVARQIFAQKYLAAHRFEIAPLAWLNLAVHEAVIYGERDLDAAYLNPVMFYRSAEHYQGDRDNATLGADLEVRPTAGVRLYGELFIDDLSIARLGDSWYGNKAAWLVGCHLTDPLRLPRSDWRLEYVRINPYVYTHTFPVNSYQQYGTLLGHEAGPNAELWYFEWLFWGSRKLQLVGTTSRYRHGANPPDRNVGGDPDRPFDVRDNQTVRFLDGILERTATFAVEARYDLWRNFRLRLALRQIEFDVTPAEGGRRPVNTLSFLLAAGINAEP